MFRTIFHLDMDAFFVSVELRRRPWLRGKPVAVGGDPSGRGVVSSASYEARRRGVRSAMPLARAKRLCPDCVFLRADFDRYADASRLLFLILDRFTPDIEPLSIEEAWLDMSGCGLLHGPPLAAADRLRGEIRRETGLSASIGIASNKLVARIASARAKPAGILRVMPGREREFLAPLPVGEIPGVGPRAGERLRLLNITTIGDITAIGERPLVSALGAAGVRLSRAARGEDAEPVSPPSSPRSVGRETTFANDLLKGDGTRAALSSLAASACRALRAAGLTARTVTLKLRYADFATVTRALTLDEPTDLDREVFAAAAALLDRAWTRRVRARLVGVRLSGLSGQSRQLEFSGDGGSRDRLERLYTGLGRIRDRYGDLSVLTGTSLRPSRNGDSPPCDPFPPAKTVPAA